MAGVVRYISTYIHIYRIHSQKMRWGGGEGKGRYSDTISRGRKVPLAGYM